MTPMIDVVFLLIIFFLISSHLTRQEQQLKLPLPVAETGAHPTQMVGPRLIVNVSEDGGVTIQDESVALEQLGARIGGALQGVPDDYTNHVSDTQRYKMLGNGWTVDVIAHIFKYMDIG